MPTRKVMMDDLRLTVEEERQVQYPNDVPSQRVQEGKDVSDDIDEKPVIVEETVRLAPKPQNLGETIQESTPFTASSDEEKERLVEARLEEIKAFRGRVFRYVAPDVVLDEAVLQTIETVRSSGISYVVNLSIKEVQRRTKPESSEEGPDNQAGKRPDQQVEDVEQHTESVKDKTNLRVIKESQKILETSNEIFETLFGS